MDYSYRSTDRNGKISEGIINANSKDEVIKIISSRNQVPIAINEKGANSQALAFKSPFKQKVKVTDLSIFCRQLSVMLNAGMPINRALDIQVTQTENLRLKGVLQEVSNAIKKGEPLSKSMRLHSDVFPKILLSMVESGESTGNLDQALERMSTHYIKENKINSKIKGAMIYPAVLAVVMVAVMVLMMVMVIPMFVDVFKDADVELPVITKFVVAFSLSLINFWYVYIGVIVVGVIFSKKILATPSGKYAFDQFKLKFKMVKKPVTQIITARFTRTLSTLLESGIPIISALAVASETTNNAVVIAAVNIASDGIKRGMSLTGELRKLNIFPLMMLSMVSIGEETGVIDELLNKTADYYDEELDAAISRLLALIEPVMIIIMGIIAGVLVLSIMLPMFAMSTGETMS